MQSKHVCTWKIGHTHAHIYLNCGDDRGESGDDGNSGIRKPHKLFISDFQLPEMGNL